MNLRTKSFEAHEWADRSARLIQDVVNLALRQQAHCSIMLTGGRSAEKLYMAWADNPDFSQMTNVQFYFGDERCVSSDHQDSNYCMAMRTLFKRGIPASCSVFRIEAESYEPEAAAERYASILPTEMDVLLLGVGEDGHIASLFPGSSALQETTRRLVPVNCPKPPHNRITIVPIVIARSRSVFVLATGTAKAAVLAKARIMPSDVNALPARLVLNATWLLDSPIAQLKV